MNQIGLADLSRPVQLDISRNLDITKPPCLDISRPVNLDITNNQNLDLTKPPQLDISEEEQQQTNLQQQTSYIGNLSLNEDINPFDVAIHSRLLEIIPIPVNRRHGFVSLAGRKMPNIHQNSSVTIGIYQ
jgi:hypothetical protein